MTLATYVQLCEFMAIAALALGLQGVDRLDVHVDGRPRSSHDVFSSGRAPGRSRAMTRPLSAAPAALSSASTGEAPSMPTARPGH